MFLGTPHRGAEGLADVAEMIASLAGIVKHVNADILRVLKTDSEMLSRIQDDFHSILRQRHSVMVNCAFEELPVRKFGMGLVTVGPVHFRCEQVLMPRV